MAGERGWLPAGVETGDRETRQCEAELRRAAFLSRLEWCWSSWLATSAGSANCWVSGVGCQFCVFRVLLCSTLCHTPSTSAGPAQLSPTPLHCLTPALLLWSSGNQAQPASQHLSIILFQISETRESDQKKVIIIIVEWESSDNISVAWCWRILTQPWQWWPPTTTQTTSPAWTERWVNIFLEGKIYF